MCFQKNSLARCTFQLLQDPDISWSPYSRILEAACRDREQRQSGPSITGSFLMRFDVFFWFQINSMLEKSQGNGMESKISWVSGCSILRFTVVEFLTSPVCTTNIWKGWKVIAKMEKNFRASCTCLQRLTSTLKMSLKGIETNHECAWLHRSGEVAIPVQFKLCLVDQQAWGFLRWSNSKMPTTL